MLKSFDENTVDLVFADPPYHLSNGGFSVQSGRMASVNKGNWDASNGFSLDVEFHRSWLTEVLRVLKPDGTLFVSGTYHSIYKCGYLMEELGFQILNELIWFKPNATPHLAGRRFAASHESIIWASPSKGGKHYFDYEAMKSFDALGDPIKKSGKQMRSVWWIPTTPASEKKWGKHPTQKPNALLDRIILACSKEGDLVLDPFCGSGTTGLVALKHNRKFVGIDNSPEFIELATRRIGEVL